MVHGQTHEAYVILRMILLDSKYFCEITHLCVENQNAINSHSQNKKNRLQRRKFLTLSCERLLVTNVGDLCKGICTKNIISIFFFNFIDRFQFSRRFGVLFCLRWQAKLAEPFYFVCVKHRVSSDYIFDPCSIHTGSILLDNDALACVVHTTELWIP